MRLEKIRYYVVRSAWSLELERQKPWGNPESKSNQICTENQKKKMGLKSGFKLSIPRNVAFYFCQYSTLIGFFTFLHKIVNSKTIAEKHSNSGTFLPNCQFSLL